MTSGQQQEDLKWERLTKGGMGWGVGHFRTLTQCLRTIFHLVTAFLLLHLKTLIQCLGPSFRLDLKRERLMMGGGVWDTVDYWLSVRALFFTWSQHFAAPLQYADLVPKHYSLHVKTWMYTLSSCWLNVSGLNTCQNRKTYGTNDIAVWEHYQIWL